MPTIARCLDCVCIYFTGQLIGKTPSGMYFICYVIDSDREGERDISHNKIIENSKRDSQFKLSEVFIEIIFLVI